MSESSYLAFFRRFARRHENRSNRETAAARSEMLEPRQLLADTIVSVVATFSDASESNRTTTGRGEYVFKRPTGDTTNPLSVRYAVNGDSTAVNGVDFETLSGRITIPAGKRAVAMNLFPINDTIDEPRETVIVSIKNSTAYTVGHRNAVVTIRDNDPPAPPPPPAGWWDTDYHYRAPISVDVGAFARSNKAVERAINFTTAIQQAGGSGSLIEDSIRVVETNASGDTVVEDDVAFQFDKASNYNASSNASGTLIFIVEGSTSASTTRHFHVYFDTAGSFTPYSFTAQVLTDANSSDEGQSAIKVTTDSATYWLQKQNGGFSSIHDTNGNDWLNFNPGSGTEAGGEYRGTPNAVFPGGGFHAGFVNGSTVIVNQGPLKTTIETTSSIDRQNAGSPHTYVMRYEFYGDYVRATMVTAEDRYWFLYEGTPGGSVNGNDTVVRSDGTVTDINTSWTDSDGLGTGNGEEWAYFRDSGVNKFMYFVHDTPDSLKDSYYLMTAGTGSMTVFGFGRNNDGGELLQMTAQNQSFTFGLADGGSDFNSAAGVVRGAYRPVSVTLGTGTKIA